MIKRQINQQLLRIVSGVFMMFSFFNLLCFFYRPFIQKYKVLQLTLRNQHVVLVVGSLDLGVLYDSDVLIINNQQICCLFQRWSVTVNRVTLEMVSAVQETCCRSFSPRRPSPTSSQWVVCFLPRHKNLMFSELTVRTLSFCHQMFLLWNLHH